MIATSDPSMVTICGKLYLKSLFNDLKFPLGILHEDEYLTPRLFHSSEKIAICKTTGYVYKQRANNSIMRSDFSHTRLVVMDIYEERVRLYKQWGYDELIFGAQQKYFWSLRYCYKKTKTDASKAEHKKIIERFKSINLKTLHMGDKFLCICARMRCLKFGEAVIRIEEKIKYYFKRIFVR